MRSRYCSSRSAKTRCCISRMPIASVFTDAPVWAYVTSTTLSSLFHFTSVPLTRRKRPKSGHRLIHSEQVRQSLLVGLVSASCCKANRPAHRPPHALPAGQPASGPGHRVSATVRSQWYSRTYSTRRAATVNRSFMSVGRATAPGNCCRQSCSSLQSGLQLAPYGASPSHMHRRRQQGERPRLGVVDG